MTTVADVLRALRERDPTSPRLTWYGPAGQDRVELSGRVLDNWVSKAGNLLLEELDEPVASRVRVDLPGGQWRFWYWSLAVLAVGAVLVLADPDPAPDLVVSTDPGSTGTPLVLVTPQALARGYPGELPAGAVDEAAVLLTYPDTLVPDEAAEPDDIAVADPLVRYRDLVPSLGRRPGATPGTGDSVRAGSEAPRLHLTSAAAPVPALRAALGVWSIGGSIVVTPSSPADLVNRLRASEAVTTAPDALPAAGLSGRPPG